MRCCNTCGEAKALSSYHKRVADALGHNRICKECRQVSSRAYWITNSKSIKDRKLSYYLENKDRVKQRSITYYRKNRESRIYKSTIYQKTRYHVDPFFNLTIRIRKRLRNFITACGFIKPTSTEKMIGCSYSQLMGHLVETWVKNYPTQTLVWDGVHVDHIVPLSSGKTIDDICRLAHYTNLQLLTASDNLKKGGKDEWSI